MITTQAVIPPLGPAGASVGSLPRAVQLVDRRHPLRARTESFVARRFLEVHGARISEFMPELLTLSGNDGCMLAAVGFRSAAEGALFLEHYLDLPVESAIARNADPVRPWPRREAIVEIGNLASVDRRASRKLFQALAGLLDARRFDWAVFTGCTSLHRMFRTLGIETVELGRALQSRLPAGQQTWGGYYEDDPRVVAGRVSRGRDVFAEPRSADIARAAA